MAGNINLPQGVEKPVKVEDNSQALRNFLLQVAQKLNEFEQRISALENK